jgi:4,5:9,10-diseco-3-hydroxy-5,9,17-trioxoandrosta-1(10),2-diene-4-oate hydrolase
MLTFEETTRTIDLDGVQVHYNEAGTGPALLCFHGGGPGANAWDNTKWNIDALSRDFRVILMDLPGYGASHNIDALEGEAHDEMYTRIMLRFMDALGIDRAHFYGTSMSGGPVLTLAHAHPERVLKLVLKSPAGMGPNLFATTPPDGIVALGNFAAEPTRENMLRMMQLFVPGPGLLTDDMVDRRFASAMAARQMAPPRVRPGAMSDIRSKLSSLQMPVLVLWAHQDHMVPIDGMLTALAEIPQVRIHLWGGGSGHFIEFEHPDEFNELMAVFLKG